MRSKTQGLLAHLFMFLPLLAVPFVASFGVPWLAAKAREEGIPVPDVSEPAPLGLGVGQSDTGRRSAEDLFSPIVREAAVDLKLAPGSPRAAGQTPHLRNASLTVSHNGPWIDPFENINPPTSPADRQTADAADASREEALADWAVNNEPAEFGPPEAPIPGEFPAALIEKAPPASQNPFAMLEKSSSPAAEGDDSHVSIEENAFEDPAPSSRAERDQNPFDARRTLFAQTETPSAPERTAERDASPPLSAKAGANLANTVNEPAKTLTWESARARLQELGIKDYYLQPDAEGQLFLFRCAYTPPDNPRINRLFEAEAREPLEAVRKVLAQVETWTNRQSASAN